MLAKFVFDTNAVVSAVLLPKSKSRWAFDAGKRFGALLVSTETIDELNEVLRRNGFDKYVSEALRVEFLAALLRDTKLVFVVEEIKECRDPKDDKFLSLAISGKADCIITGDKDLLILHPFREVQILTPGEFLDSEWVKDNGTGET